MTFDYVMNKILCIDMVLAGMFIIYTLFNKGDLIDLLGSGFALGVSLLLTEVGFVAFFFK